ncbi:MAG: MFS transporter, partial [Dehalococcoidia bacterium]|nr:MFS transporter [Dehalococcoidia bacterium]
MVPASFFERHAGLAALASRDYRLLLLGSTLVGMAMPLQFLTQIFWVQDNYPHRDVFYVGLIAGSRGVAMLVFSLLGGAIADRFERRRVLLWCEVAALLLNGGVALLMLTNPFGDATIAALIVFTFFAAGNMAIDMPARNAAIPAVVGMDHIGSAISLNMVAMQATFPLMVPVTGLVNDLFAPGHVYSASLLAWAAIIPLIAALRFRDTGRGDRTAGVLRNIGQGLGYTRRDATIFAVISLLILLQVVGMPGVATLGPVWMTDVLGLSKREFGLIGMTWGLGTMIGSVFFAWRSALSPRGTTLCA